MFNALIKGFVLGFISAMPLGPVGIICVRNNIAEGIKSAGKISLGSITVDFFYALIVVMGITSISRIITINEGILKLIGGFILIYVGLIIYFGKKRSKKKEFKFKNHKDFFTGFTLGIFNPFTFFLMTFLFVGFGYKSFLGNYGGIIYFLIGTLAGFFTIWGIVLLLPYFIKRKYDLSYLSKFKKLGGIIITSLGSLIILNFLRSIFLKF